MSIKLFLDSGAFGIYKKLSKASKDGSAMSSLKTRSGDDFSYTKSKEYKHYRKQYAEFLKEQGKYFDVYANLDVIGNAEHTYKNQKCLEKQGLSPCPVWHITSDIKWLKKYIDEGYDYICIGAMVGISSSVLQQVLDRIWGEVLTDNEGMPLVKIHGFGTTSFKLMKRYPWYSVDSSSWQLSAGYGNILYPGQEKEEYDWNSIRTITISNIGFRKNSNNHFKNQPSYLRKHIQKYLEDIKIPFGKSSFKKVNSNYKCDNKKEIWYIKNKEIEIIKIPGVLNSKTIRAGVNLYAYTQFEQHLPKWPWPLVFKNRKRLL